MSEIGHIKYCCPFIVSNINTEVPAAAMFLLYKVQNA
jgi:hypothetical protein